MALGNVVSFGVNKVTKEPIALMEVDGGIVGVNDVWFRPSKDWSQGGPIIEREGIEIFHDSVTHKSPEVWSAVKYLPPPLPGEVINVEQDGPTPLIAAMRCFVASKLGEEVEIP